MIRGRAFERFLPLLSRLGQDVALKTGTQLELGLSVSKAVVKYQGRAMMVDTQNIADNSWMKRWRSESFIPI